MADGRGCDAANRFPLYGHIDASDKAKQADATKMTVLTNLRGTRNLAVPERIEILLQMN
jgi:hypothetical protein